MAVNVSDLKMQSSHMGAPTFMYISLEKRARDGGCKMSIPCKRFKALRSRVSLEEFGGIESNRSRQVIRCVVTIFISLSL